MAARSGLHEPLLDSDDEDACPKPMTLSNPNKQHSGDTALYTSPRVGVSRLPNLRQRKQAILNWGNDAAICSFFAIALTAYMTLGFYFGWEVWMQPPHDLWPIRIFSEDYWSPGLISCLILVLIAFLSLCLLFRVINRLFFRDPHSDAPLWQHFGGSCDRRCASVRHGHCRSKTCPNWLQQISPRSSTQDSPSTR